MIEYGVDLTSKGTVYAAGGEGKTKKYLNAVLYDHIVNMTLPYIGKYRVGYNDGDNVEIVAKNAVIKLGVSPCTEVGAELVVTIISAIKTEVPSLSSSSSSSSSTQQSNSPESLPQTFKNIFKSPFDDAFYVTGPQPNPEEDDNPLSLRKNNNNLKLSHLFRRR